MYSSHNVRYFVFISMIELFFADFLFQAFVPGLPDFSYEIMSQPVPPALNVSLTFSILNLTLKSGIIEWKKGRSEKFMSI